MILIKGLVLSSGGSRGGAGGGGGGPPQKEEMPAGLEVWICHCIRSGVKLKLT